MKILLINKSFSIGGAAIAARRLWKALLNSKVDAVFMVYDETHAKEDRLEILTNGKFGLLKWWFLFILERLYFLPFEKNKSVRFSFSPAVAGQNIACLKSVQSVDVIHLHWFNQGFLSMKNLRQIGKLQKPIVWTLHDMWAFTGGCHYNSECYNYSNDCGNCWYLKKPATHDLSYRVLQQKKGWYSNVNITFVTCSSWLKEEAEKSSVLKGKRILSIPNPIDTQLYVSANRIQIRQELKLSPEKKYILFGAANVNDERKGIKFLVEALGQLKDSIEIEVLLFGKNGNIVAQRLPFKTHNFGLIGSVPQLVRLYQAADLFVLPSLQDNLPNTVMESMACGTPVVAFKIGGIPEMVDHKQNGYLAEYKSAEDLASGIEWVLQNNPDNVFGKAAREKVIREFSEEVVAQKYINLYQSLLNE